MTSPRYPKYKDSGVQWLGQIPAHWRVSRLGFECQTLVPMRDKPQHLDGAIPWIRIEDFDGKFVSRSKSGQGVSQDTANAMNLKILPTGTVLCSCSCSMGATAIVAEPMVTNQTFIGIVPSQRFSSDYLYYFFNAAAAYLDSIGTGAIQSYLSRDDFRRLRVPQPPSLEQTQLAAFLDCETAKIDALVAEQRRLLELLQEKRQAAISHAVTKGLNPHAPMKHSGIEWLGEVPAHWEITRVKWIARMESGHTPDKQKAEYWENGDIPWVSLNDTGYLKDHDYVSDTAYRITALGLENSSARLLPPRVVVFSRDATIGRCAITARSMAVSQHFIAWVCGEKIVPEYLLLRLRSMTQELDRLTAGATVKTIGMPDVRTMVSPVPPLEEQQEIVTRVSQATAEIDALIVQSQHATQLLQERRTALISAAVTGQIDVRQTGSPPSPTAALAHA